MKPKNQTVGESFKRNGEQFKVVAITRRGFTARLIAEGVSAEPANNDAIAKPSLENLLAYLHYQYPSTKGNIPLAELCDRIAGLVSKDNARMDHIESQGDGSGWVSRQSSTGRGYRLHNVGKGCESPDVQAFTSARAAIDFDIALACKRI